MLNEDVLTSFLHFTDGHLIFEHQRFCGFECRSPILSAQQLSNLLLNRRSAHCLARETVQKLNNATKRIAALQNNTPNDTLKCHC